MCESKYDRVLDQLDSDIGSYKQRIEDYKWMMCDLETNSVMYKAYESMINRADAKIEALEDFKESILNI